MGNKRRLHKDFRGKSTESSSVSRPGRYARIGAICVMISIAAVLLIACLWPLDETALMEPWEMPDLPEPTIELPVEAVPQQMVPGIPR